MYILFRVFWVNIVISKLNLLYRYCLKLIGKLRKEKEFRQQCCRNSTKIRRKKEEEFQQHCYRNSSAQIPARRMKKKQLRQCHYRNRKKGKKIFGNCGNGIAKNGKKKLNGIMAISLPKMGGKKKNLLPKSGKKF